MPLYENRVNAENVIQVSEAARASVIFDQDKILNGIAERLGAGKKVCVDGWYGVDWAALAAEMKQRSPGATLISANRLFADTATIAAYKQTFLTDDPAFGHANLDGRIEDILDEGRVAQVERELAGTGGVLVYGCGAAAQPLREHYDVLYYFDMTRQPLLWQMWDGKLIPFASEAPRADYMWKEYYYCDFYLLDNHKEQLVECMDFYVEAIDFADLKLVPRNAYDEIIQTMVRYPVKEVKIYQPGPWGAYRYKDFWEVPGLECNAWNELAGPELSILIDFGAEKMLNVPFVALMQYGEQFVGKHIHQHYPKLFPMDVWLDDGYFPKPEPAERISMPIHNHPSTDYVKRHFNEPIGRYETYYIAEAYEGANTWMGYSDDVDLEEWEKKCRASNNLTPIEDWKDFMVRHDSNVGDLYLIPPGTAHGHGGNQMVLEMDTCPSIAGTEYSFFQYDFARNSWDDGTKTMTGRPMKMHLEHGFDNEKWRREGWVKDHLLPKAKVVTWTKEFYKDRYDSLPEMPFEIERLHFYKRAENDTEGMYCHVLTLTVGSAVTIRSKGDPCLATTIDLFQSCTVPASFGEYEVINSDSGNSTLVVLRWKKGEK